MSANLPRVAARIDELILEIDTQAATGKSPGIPRILGWAAEIQTLAHYVYPPGSPILRDISGAVGWLSTPAPMFNEKWGSLKAALKAMSRKLSFDLAEPAGAIGQGEKIFIGHGRSRMWLELKDLLRDELGLDHEEFNREAVAGDTAKERLVAMLDGSRFALLVFTGDDEHADGTRHARENVIHEAGLFQGRLGFRKAIVLLEDGCEEFNNLAGVQHIPFPRGNIKAAFEDVRRVLRT